MSYKPSLHKYTVRLYDDDDLEAEIVDFIAEQPASRRQELLRTFIKVGFGVLVSKKKTRRALNVGKRHPSGTEQPERPGSTERSEPSPSHDIQREPINRDQDSFPSLDDLPSLPFSKGANRGKTDETYHAESQDEFDELDPLARLRDKVRGDPES